MALNPKIRDWQGKRVWLIGASSGIGAALAHALLQRGARVAISARRAEALHAVLQQAGGTGLALPFDASRASEWPAAQQQLLAAWGGVACAHASASARTFA